MIATTNAVIDQARAEAFADKMIDVLNSGALALATSIGHRTGLFDTLAELPPSTSEEIARAAGLNERYVREWLGAVVTGGIVEYDPALCSFWLPAEHAAWLTRAASPDNLAVPAQYIPILAGVEDRIVECFREGGGVDYCHFTRFHQVMAEDSGQTVVAALFDAILPLVPGLTDRLAAGIEVLDVGCGSGRALIELAEAFPRSRFAGYDLSQEAIARARAEVRARGLNNVTFEVRDVAELDEPGRYDFITAFDAIHDQANPSRVLAGICRALRPDGVLLMQDIAGSTHLENNLGHPIAALLYTISFMHCMTVSLAQGGDGLGTMWGREQADQMLREAGFGQIDVHQLAHDFQNYFYVVRV
jgi:2-polyprenyl-3-methyl-5-hydroxy-6-metoxy-1,4-benzoquinol methylase